MSGPFYLGVDGGQSSTKAVIGDSAGNILGRGLGGPCNHARQGEGRAKLERGLTSSVGQALEPLSLTLADVCFERICIGMSGGPDDKHEIIRSLIQAKAYDVTTDAHIALYGAVAGGAGAIVIAGTGSIALSRGADGRVWRAGGWGYVFGDEGSGFDIGRKALRASLQAEEGWGPATLLRAILLEETGSANANELLHRCYAGEFSRDQTAAWSRLADSAADQNDPVALGILADAGQALGESAAAVARMARLAPSGAIICPIGGVFENQRVLAGFSSVLAERLSTAPTKPLSSPEIGALNAAIQGISLALA